MTSYLSNLLTTTTNKYTTLRRTLLPDENDGDTEDDTHICRSLRAYYIEKQRPFPPWLPPDPNERRQAYPSQNAYGQPSAGLYGQPGGGGAYFTGGGRPGGPQSTPSGGSRRGGGLSDLWDSGPAQQAGPAQPQSLRARPAPSPQPSYASQGGASARSERFARPQGGREPSYGSQRGGGGGGGGREQQGDPALFAANAAAGRAGGAGFAGGSGPPQIARATSTQDRLKARLWGAGGNGGAPGAAGYR